MVGSEAKRARHQRIVRGRDFSKIQKKKRMGYILNIQKENKVRVFFFFLKLLKNKSREQKMFPVKPWHLKLEVSSSLLETLFLTLIFNLKP